MANECHLIFVLVDGLRSYVMSDFRSITIIDVRFADDSTYIRMYDNKICAEYRLPYLIISSNISIVIS